MEQWYWKWKFFLFNIFLRISTIDTIFCPLSVILKIIVSYNFFSLANLMHVNSKYFFEKSESVSLSLLPHGLKHARLFCPWNSPGKNTGMGSHSLLQGIFLTQGSNSGLLHCRQIPLPSEPPGKPPLKEAQLKTHLIAPVQKLFGPRAV